jgi:3'-5' exoribonuclease
MMTTMKDLTEGSEFNLVVLVEKKKESTTKGGKAYLDLTVRDETKALNAKIWEFNPLEHFFITEGSVVGIIGTVESYNGNLQLKVKSVLKTGVDPMQFARRTRFDVEKMWADLVDMVGSFQEPLTKFVAEEILLKHDRFIQAYKKAPAAKIVHNAWYGGLLEHVHSLCAIAEPTIKHYQTKYVPKLSRDKVLFGLMMHDAGKIIEYDYTKPSFNLTGLGVLTNHMVLGPAWVYEIASKFSERPDNFKMERAHLMHILAAHHGQIEWGSPVKPATLEAILVHHLDNLDAKMLHAIELIEGDDGEIPGFSQKSYFEKVPYLKQ